MATMKITIETLKGLVEELGNFSNGKNSLQVQVGFKKGHDGKVPTTATIVDGGNQITKGFIVLAEDDTKCSFSVNASEFLSITSAMLAYQETIEFDVTDTSVTLKAGANASMPLALLSEAEQQLPFDISKSYVALLLDTGKFLTFARKGCFLSDTEDTRNIADRVVIKLELTGDGVMHGFSMDGNSFATAQLSLKPSDTMKQPVGYKIKPYFMESKLRQLAENLSEDDKASLDELIDEAAGVATSEDFSSLTSLCIEKKINVSELKISLLADAFELLKKVVKNTTMFQVAITDMYCIVLTNNTTAVFTLGSTVPTFYDNLDQMTKDKPIAEVVVDTHATLNGLSLMLLNQDIKTNKEPVLVSASDSGIVISYGESSTMAPYVEKKGAIGATSLYMRASLMKKIISSMDNGNLYIRFCGEKNPLLIRNGALEDELTNFAFVLPVSKEVAKVESKKEATDEE